MESKNTYLGVQHDNVLDPSVADIILDPSVLPDTSHADSVGAVAVEILDVDVGGVWLGREAIIANVDPCVGDAESVNVVGIPSVSVLWQILVIGEVLNHHSIVHDVFC